VGRRSVPQVIDASLCGKTPAETDLKAVFGFFGG
jgi:hypothetical protein